MMGFSFLKFLTSSKMHSSFGLTSLNVHRIAISALLLGAKLSRDRYFTNVSLVSSNFFLVYDLILLCVTIAYSFVIISNLFQTHYAKVVGVSIHELKALEMVINVREV